jgi:AbrB family looped-hinge helix DNA binding protein
MSSHHVKIAQGGRVVIPAELRKALGVGVGDTMVIELDGDELRLRSQKAMIKRIQAIVRKYVPPEASLSDELIQERRGEARREALE